MDAYLKEHKSAIDFIKSCGSHLSLSASPVATACVLYHRIIRKQLESKSQDVPVERFVSHAYYLIIIFVPEYFYKLIVSSGCYQWYFFSNKPLLVHSFQYKRKCFKEKKSIYFSLRTFCSVKYTNQVFF